MPSSTLLFFSLLLLAAAALAVSQSQEEEKEGPFLLPRRALKLPVEAPPKKKPNTTITTNPTKPLKPKATNSTSSSAAALLLELKKKNTTKLLKPKTTNSSSTTAAAILLATKKNTTAATATTKFLKLKSTNSTGATLKLDGKKNTTKLLKPKSTTSTTTTLPKASNPGKKNPDLPPKTPTVKKNQGKSIPKPVPIMPWIDDKDEDEDADLISEFRNLPSRFHAAVVPDLRKISTTSKAYLALARMEFTRSFKPLVGTRYAPPVANLAFAMLLLLPLLLVAVLFRRLRAHLPLQKVLLSAHIYLAVYFTVLAAAGAAAGTEPLRFFHAASPGAYVGTQVMLMMAYVTYLLLQLVEVAASGQARAALAAVRLALTMAVGVHYYASVFHRAVHGDAPRTSWKVHAVYAACFAAVCALAGAGRGKKEYVHGGGGEDCKKS